MELLWVPVVLWLVTAFVPSSDAFARIPICPPPSPISCTFPNRPLCAWDENQVATWFCSNWFTGKQYLAPKSKSGSAMDTLQDLASHPEETTAVIQPKRAPPSTSTPTPQEKHPQDTDDKRPAPPSQTYEAAKGQWPALNTNPTLIKRLIEYPWITGLYRKQANNPFQQQQASNPFQQQQAYKSSPYSTIYRFSNSYSSVPLANMLGGSRSALSESWRRPSGTAKGRLTHNDTVQE